MARSRLPPPQRVLALKGCYRLNGMSATDRLHACLRQSEVPDLSFLNEVLHRSRNVLDRHVRIHAMLVEQVDRIHPQALERSLSDLFDGKRGLNCTFPDASITGRLASVMGMDDSVDGRGVIRGS